MTVTRSGVRSVALPAQHGGWGFLTEPILLGLLTAYSTAGLSLSLAAASLFLLQHPLLIALKDRQRGRRFARTRLAERFALIYGGLGLVFGLIALVYAGLPVLAPLLIALPLAAIQLAYDLRNESRAALPEIAGALALGTSASMIGLAGGLAPLAAALLWLVVALRALPSILYVRARLRVQRSLQTGLAPFNPQERTLPLAAHLAALVIAAVLWLAQLASSLLPLAATLLLIRAAYGLRLPQPVTPAKIIGVQEIVLGLAYVILAAA